MRLIDELDELHDHYARLVEAAVARDDLAAAESLAQGYDCLLYTSPSPRDGLLSRMPSSA